VRSTVSHVLAAIFLVAGAIAAWAHPMPDSHLVLGIHETWVDLQAEIPLTDLSLATGLDFGSDPASAVGAKSAAIAGYIEDHIRVTDQAGAEWTVEIVDLSVASAEMDAGTYAELVVDMTLTPPAGAGLGSFILTYDAVVHQVLTHKVFVSVGQDSTGGEPVSVGVIRADVKDGSVPPFTIDLSTALR
jgi:hypothetical protein